MLLANEVYIIFNKKNKKFDKIEKICILKVIVEKCYFSTATLTIK